MPAGGFGAGRFYGDPGDQGMKGGSYTKAQNTSGTGKPAVGGSLTTKPSGVGGSGKLGGASKLGGAGMAR